MWAAQYYKYQEAKNIPTSGGLGTMGYGLGAAIGARVGSLIRLLSILQVTDASE